MQLVIEVTSESTETAKLGSLCNGKMGRAQSHLAVQEVCTATEGHKLTVERDIRLRRKLTQGVCLSQFNLFLMLVWNTLPYRWNNFALNLIPAAKC